MLLKANLMCDSSQGHSLVTKTIRNPEQTGDFVGRTLTQLRSIFLGPEMTHLTVQMHCHLYCSCFIGK